MIVGLLNIIFQSRHMVLRILSLCLIRVTIIMYMCFYVPHIGGI